MKLSRVPAWCGTRHTDTRRVKARRQLPGWQLRAPLREAFISLPGPRALSPPLLRRQRFPVSLACAWASRGEAVGRGAGVVYHGCFQGGFVKLWACAAWGAGGLEGQEAEAALLPVFPAARRQGLREALETASG